MAVTVVFGMTQSGKSHHVEKREIKKTSRVIVFDPMNCFKSMELRLSLDEKFKLENASLQKAFKFAIEKKEFFSIGLRPGKQLNYSHTFDKVARTAMILGEKIASDERKILLVADEAGDICSPHMISDCLKMLVTRGRHYNVDSLFIAQRPQMIHGDIRANASKVVCFNLATAPEIPWLAQTFGRKIVDKIPVLPQYHCAVWDNTGKIYFLDESGREYKERG